MRLRIIFAVNLMSIMMVSHSVPAMASGFTDFIMKNQTWSYADMRSISNTDGSVLGVTKINVPYTDCMVLCKSESCVKVVVNGIVEKVIPANTSIKDGTYTLTNMYPETSISGVLEITDTSGDIKNIGGEACHVSVSGQDSLLLAEMATIGEKVLVRA